METVAVKTQPCASLIANHLRDTDQTLYPCALAHPSLGYLFLVWVKKNWSKTLQLECSGHGLLITCPSLNYHTRWLGLPQSNGRCGIRWRCYSVDVTMKRSNE